MTDTLAEDQTLERQARAREAADLASANPAPSTDAPAGRDGSETAGDASGTEAPPAVAGCSGTTKKGTPCRQTVGIVDGRCSKHREG